MRLDGDVQDTDSVSDDDTNDLYNSVIDFPNTCQASARYTGPRKLLEQAAQDTRYSSKYHRSAVNAEGIPNHGLTASSGRVVRKMVDDFQDSSPTTKKVLVLNWANSSAAGA